MAAKHRWRQGVANIRSGGLSPRRHSDFGTNRKLSCDFRLVINTNLPSILHCFQVMADCCMFDSRLIADFNIAIICRAYFIYTLGFC